MKNKLTGLFLGGSLILGGVFGANAAQEAGKADTLGEKFKAKSIALSGKGSLGSVINEGVFINNDGTYNPATIQKVKEAVKNLNHGTFKNASKYLSSNKEGLMYKNKLSAAVAEAEKIREEMNKGEEQQPEKTPEKGEEEQPEKTPEKGEEQQPEKTPEKGEAEAEAVTTTWAFDAATGKYVEYANGVATGNTKDAVDNFSKETDTIQWAVDDEQVYVEHLTTKKVVIGATEVTIYLRADGSIYAIVDDENTIKWKDADEQLKPMIEGALHRLQLEESTNYKEYQSNGRTYRVYMNDAGNITDFCIMADGEIDKVMGWDRFTDEQKAEVLSHLNGKASSEESKEEQPQVELQSVTYTTNIGQRVTIYFDDNRNIVKTVTVWGETVTEKNASEIDAELNAFLQSKITEQLGPMQKEETTEEASTEELNTFTFSESGFDFKIQYDNNGTIVDAIMSDGAIEMTWDAMGESEKEYLTDKLNNYLHSDKHDIGEPDQKQEASTEAKEKITIDLREYYNIIDTNETKIQKLEVQMNELEVEIQHLNEQNAEAMEFNDWDKSNELDQQIYELQEKINDLQNEWQGCINAIEDAEGEIESKERIGDSYIEEGYEVEYLRDYAVTEDSFTESSPSIELPEEIQPGGTTEEIPEEFGDEITLEDPTTNNTTEYNNATEYGSSEDEWTNNSGGAWVEYQGQLPN